MRSFKKDEFTIWSSNQSYDTTNPYKFDNVINVRALDMSLFNTEKNEPTITA